MNASEQQTFEFLPASARRIEVRKNQVIEAGAGAGKIRIAVQPEEDALVALIGAA